MKVIKGTLNFKAKQCTVVTLGKFDGIHRGHQALIDRVLSYPDPQALSCVCTFETSPIGLLTKKERRKMLESMGIDLLVECPFTAELISMDAEIFVKKILVKQLHAVHVVVGADYRFGYKRGGNVDTLVKLGKKYGFSVEVVHKVMDTEDKVSSGTIREELSAGHMERVNELLGYEYYITGEIIHGENKGTSFGFPTTNLIPKPSKLLPPNGVYATRTLIGDKTYMGMTNIGCKPTVNGSFVGVETHLFDCSGDLYGEKEQVQILHYIRPEKKFDSILELQTQIQKDRGEIKEYIKKVQK